MKISPFNIFLYIFQPSKSLLNVTRKHVTSKSNSSTTTKDDPKNPSFQHSSFSDDKPAEELTTDMRNKTRNVKTSEVSFFIFLILKD